MTSARPNLSAAHMPAKGAAFTNRCCLASTAASGSEDASACIHTCCRGRAGQGRSGLGWAGQGKGVELRGREARGREGRDGRGSSNADSYSYKVRPARDCCFCCSQEAEMSVTSMCRYFMDQHVYFLYLFLNSLQLVADLMVHAGGVVLSLPSPCHKRSSM